MASQTPAAGIRVLLIEDEPIVALLAEDMLESIGCILAGTAASVGDGLAAVTSTIFDVAMVDVNLDGEDGLIVADMLKSRGIPYFITTGYDARGTAPNHPEAPMLSKPYSIDDLEATVCRCTGRA